MTTDHMRASAALILTLSGFLTFCEILRAAGCAVA